MEKFTATFTEDLESSGMSPCDSVSAYDSND